LYKYLLKLHFRTFVQFVTKNCIKNKWFSSNLTFQSLEFVLNMTWTKTRCIFSYGIEISFYSTYLNLLQTFIFLSHPNAFREPKLATWIPIILFRQPWNDKANEGNFEDLRKHWSYKCQTSLTSIFGRVLIGGIKSFMFPVGHGWAEIIVPLSPFEITTSQILFGGLENVTRTQNFWRG